jgi:hypothetical protein
MLTRQLGAGGAIVEVARNNASRFKTQVASQIAIQISIQSSPGQVTGQ